MEPQTQCIPAITTQADPNVVRSAVQHDGAALEFASDDLRGDKEVWIWPGMSKKIYCKPTKTKRDLLQYDEYDDLKWSKCM